MASTILELAASMIRIFGQMRLGRLLIAAATAALCVETSPAWADTLIYRCGPNVCRAAPDGTFKRQLTRDGRPQGPLYSWVSASADGSRLAVVRATFAQVLDGRGRQVGANLPRGGTAVVARMAPDGSQVATIELLPEITPAPVGSPPGSPGISGFQPYLFVMGADGQGRQASARAVIDAGWLGPRVARSDPSSTDPFPFGVCLLAANDDFACERDLARDPTQDLFNPAFSRDGARVAVVRSPDEELGSGPIVIYDAATAAPVRTLTGGADAHPTWSPDGRRIAFQRGDDIHVAQVSGGERRVLAGAQPVWTSAPACRSRPRLRVRGRRVIVSACAPHAGRVTISLRGSGRRTVRAATGGTVTVRLRRPAGALRVRAKFRRQ